jgi:hypothetical protein
VADLLSLGHSPHPLAWSQATSSQSCAAAGRPLMWLVFLRLAYRSIAVRTPQGSS